MKKEQTGFEKMELAAKLQSKINCLISKLAATNSPIGDWKIIKIYEARLAGIAEPYDHAELAAERQKVRDEINELQIQYEKLLKEDF